jgi:hypothetical protein
LPLRRITLFALLLLLLLALASRLISGIDNSDTEVTVGPSPDTAFGTMIYVGMIDRGLHVWEFNDPSCPKPIHILKLPLSGEAEPLAQLLRQSGENAAYWYGGTIYEQVARLTWLFRFEVGRLPLHVKNRLSKDFAYLVIFYPAACGIPQDADWPLLEAAIYQ